MERIKLFYSSEIEAPWSDLEKIKACLVKLEEAGISIEQIDTADMKEEERHNIYIEEVIYPSVINRYRIAHMFGTQQKSGLYFGKRQPCLLFFEVDAERATDVFPHTVKGQNITIEEFLSKKIEEMGRQNQQSAVSK